MKISVIGTGTMGSGIVQTFAQAGVAVVMKGENQSELDRGSNMILKSLSWLVEKNSITVSEKERALSLITPTIEYSAIKDSALILEVVIEQIELKKEIFSHIDKIASPTTILASNTSSLSITQLAAATSRPSQVVGMHFFNPAPIMKLVEVIKGEHTSNTTAQFVYDLAKEIGKTPIFVNESAGFVVNRVLIPMINEAVALLAEGVASAQEIDEAMKSGANHPIGPLALADLIGNDVCLAIMEVLQEELGEDKYRAHPLLKKMVRAGKLGRKSGVGFYSYR
ncbi:MAG: 3-hydroxyacyl-CoA dehydrogenase NAD-binding domain-containing protein [Bacteroidales bacterium]